MVVKGTGNVAELLLCPKRGYLAGCMCTSVYMHVMYTICERILKLSGVYSILIDNMRFLWLLCAQIALGLYRVCGKKSLDKFPLSSESGNWKRGE